MPKGSKVETVPGQVSDADVDTHRAKARIGTTLRGKWRLDALLGVGGMAAVYAATHRNGTRAAVKILHLELAAEPGIKARFLREGEIANAVGHEGAVRVLDDDAAEDGSLYLVTELLEGETLEERRARCGGTLAEGESLFIADQILDVLEAAHDKGVVHRDLKPENIFVTRTGQVKVLDFGIARARGLGSVAAQTRVGATLGTPPYMAPEQARGLWDEVDAQTDVWACGATLFRILSGRLVHDGRTANEELLSAMTNPAAPLASVAPGVSTEVAAIVDRALAFAKDDRWPSARAMQEAVRAAYASANATPISSAPKPVVPDAAVHRTVRSLPDLFDEEAAARSPDAAPTAARGNATRREGLAAVSVAAASLPGAITESVSRTQTSQASSISLVAGVPTPMASAQRRWVLVAAGALVLGLAVVAWRSLSSEPRAAPAAAPAASVPAVAPPHASAASPPAEVAPSGPTVEAAGPIARDTSAPVSTAAPSRPTADPRARATTPTRSKPDAANCTPPYVVDPATGKKNWKMECL